jgi:hypothetical protein
MPVQPSSQPEAPGPSLEGIPRASRRNRGQKPIRYRQPEDVLPEPLAPLPEIVAAPPQQLVPSDTVLQDDATTADPHIWRTERNTFGLLREYYGERPVHDPNEHVSIDDLVVNPIEKLNAELDALPVSTYAPWPNLSSAMLAKWFIEAPSNSLSIATFLRLRDVLINPSFETDDLVDVNFASIFKDMGSDGEGGTFNEPDGWRKVDVPILIPSFKRGVSPHTFRVPNLLYRPLTDVIRSICQSERIKRFHLTPYRLLWKPNQHAKEQVIEGEFYTSPAFIEAHLEIQRLPKVVDCDLPRAMIALLIASDSTHLAQFGTASLWPVYLMFGNESKYTRGRPSACACHHVAYIPKVCFAFICESKPHLPIPTPVTRQYCGLHPSAQRWQTCQT